MIMNKYMFFCIFILIFGAQNIFGQGFIGPGAAGGAQPVMSGGPVSITEARNLAHDSFVILNGNVISALPGGKNYTFRDFSGEITVEIGSKHWRGLSVVPSDNVTIYGEVKIHRGHVSIKAHAITGSGRVNVRPGQPVMISGIASVMEARNLPQDSFAILNGNIINFLPERNHYTFRDFSGDITVEIGPKHWRGLAVGVSDSVEIYCEVKISRGQVKLKVHAVRPL